MGRVFLLALLALLVPAGGAAQDKPVAEAAADRRRIEVSFKSGQPMPARFAATAGELRHYRLVELEPADAPGAVSADRTAWLDPAAPAVCAGFGCQRLQLRLVEELPVGQTFILAISDFTNAGTPVTIRFTVAGAPPSPAKAKITAGPDTTEFPSQLQIRADEELTIGGPIVVRRVYYEISSDGLSYDKKAELFAASVYPAGRPSNRFVLTLDKKLVEGRDHFLEIDTGIANALGQAVKAEGTVKIAGIPTKTEELRYDINLASNVAVHQRPIFEASAKINPYNPNLRPKPAFGTEWLWEPSATVDIGLRSTKSANSVILTPLNFSNIFFENADAFRMGKHTPRQLPGLKTGGAAAAAPPKPGTRYADWLSTPWHRPANLKFTVGPKAEFDRNFKRKNVLGTLRFDLNLHRWDSSISSKRRLLKSDFERVDENVASQARLNFGLSVVPSLMFDFGGHVNNETVSKKVGGVDTSVFVPRHKIFRSYLGFNSAMELNDLPVPLTLQIEEWLVHLGTTESIGFTTDNGAFLRNLRGFHHRGKATLSLALGRSKHYNLTLTYENGRAAPNFEYLNKLTSGVRVVY